MGCLNMVRQRGRMYGESHDQAFDGGIVDLVSSVQFVSAVDDLTEALERSEEHRDDVLALRVSVVVWVPEVTAAAMDLHAEVACDVAAIKISGSCLARHYFK